MIDAGNLPLRRSPRVPLIRPALFEDRGGVFKAQTINLSQGGILLGEISHFPISETIPLMFDIPSLPTHKDVCVLDTGWDLQDETARKVVRVCIRVLRREKRVGPRLAGEFLAPPLEFREIVSSYIDRFNENLLYLLGATQKEQEQEEDERKLMEKAFKLVGLKAQNRLEMRAQLQMIYGQI